jgi:5-methylcytosine-specific restriction endonuclease McrA
MPSSPTPMCLDCTLRAVNGTKYCAKHQTDNSVAQYKRLYDIYRQDDPIRKLYRTKRWKATRLKVFRRDILCKVEEGCPHAAKVADHFPLSAREIVASLGEAEFYNPERCRGLCKFHHDQSTAIREGFARKKQG